MMGLRCTDLHVVLGATAVLRGLSAELPAGRLTAVIGPSGAGKSTLLHTLAGLCRPHRGGVQLDDDEVTGWPAERRRLGVVFQDLRLFPFLDVRENVAFGPQVAGLPPDEQRRRVERALALARATAFADRSVHTLSGGERQRVAIARALAMAPRGLLLDEPFGGLDAALRRELRDELRALIHELRLTTLLVTHDRDDAFALASHLLVLNQGRVEQAGEVATCYERPVSAFVAMLLGEATFLPVQQRRGERARLGGAWVEVCGAGTTAVLRPERVFLLPPRTPEEEARADGLTGQLLDARFSAGRWRLLVALPDHPTPLIALVDRPPASQLLHLGVRGPLPLIPDPDQPKENLMSDPAVRSDPTRAAATAHLAVRR